MNFPWRQLTIIHLTDLHFGPNHAFQPPLPTDGHPAVTKGWPTLLQSLTKDWATGSFSDRGIGPPESSVDNDKNPNSRVILAITGDLTEQSRDTEFRDAVAFVRGCSTSTIMGWHLTPEDVFVVPGNHDLLWENETPGGRWLPYTYFYRQLTNVVVDPEKPEALTKIIDCSEDGLIIAEINSCAYIQRHIENRGQVDRAAITELKRQLDKIEQAKLDSSIKLAFLHHHPVILPGLAEPKEGYSAVVNSNALLERLREYGFHLILHGHKHLPFTFWYDPVCAWVGNEAQPIMVAAGGTAGSLDIARVAGATNTYNIITLKWDPVLMQVRIHVETRGLYRYTDKNAEIDPEDWCWKTLAVSDRHFELTQPNFERHKIGKEYEPSPRAARQLEVPRDRAYRANRRNFPTIKILPSLDPLQGYEARVQIEGQPGRPGYEPPEKVEWWAGPRFKNVSVVTRAEDPTFSSVFTYWGPMLIQARLHWKEGKPGISHVFAPLPSAGG
jgi:3',5'-cyclic AMP phosphodiesterase CpdA